MRPYITFDARIIPMDWGKSTYTVLPLPDDILVDLGAPKRVEGEIADAPVNLAVTRAPVIETAFLYTGKTFLKEAGIDPGDRVEVRLRAADPNQVDEPPALTTALRSAALTQEWQRLTPGKRRGLIAPINAARSPKTQAARIARVLAELKGSR
ncbi:YdeI/OmpD-associated family protein [Sulfitobacter aestuariivivens]|uniref:YdeI/OmpD-associated family protein n=1 Tax=Sulfitobacter aestuariivivens TaxID=2766981 RepID=A0A927HF63_9RHOB|nr:YdeI/OmpD-associated family protein [Sulfitobacter aestuariivivens]MBD3664616.1 YdeI/OmpD-associated family protein [Sulfitobacter aestuariivivens]